MRKLIVCNIVTLDGYYTGPDNNVMVMPMDAGFDAYNVQRMRAADMLLLGRTTYDGFRGFWPSVADDPSPRWSADHREISRIENAIDKVVVSDSLTAEETEPWRDTTRIISRAEAHGAIADLKQRDGGEILMFGSHTLWSDLLAHGLVDELHLMVGPVILGEGRRAFEGRPPVSVRPIEARRLDGSELVLTRYEVRPDGA